MTQPSIARDVETFLTNVVNALGLELKVVVESTDDGIYAELTGQDVEPLLRRKGEGLEALQHITTAIYSHTLSASQRLVVDCDGFRKAKDREVQRIARFLMEKVQNTGVPQEIGPLNSYARRLVHLEVATAPDLASESQGDGAIKTVLITRRSSA